MPLQVQDSDKTKLEVHGSVIAQLRVKNSYRILRGGTAVPLQVQDSEKTEIEVHGRVRTWPKLSLQVQGIDKTK